MFESAETKEQWLTDLECMLEDIEREIRENPYGATSKEIDRATRALTKWR